MPEPITHVIFDFDGLLVDTETSYTLANTQLLQPYGIEFTMELKRKQMGKKHDESIVFLLKEVGLSDKITPEEYSAKYDVILNELFKVCKVLPGAENLVRQLVSKGVHVGLCTGSCSRTFPIKATHHKHWLDLIKLQVLTGDDPEVQFGKPHPQPFLVTMGRFDVKPKSPQNVLVFEDSYNGVLSALDAGMQCIMVPDRKVFDPDTDPAFKARVTEILDSLEQFQPEKYGLPTFGASQ